MVSRVCFVDVGTDRLNYLRRRMFESVFCLSDCLFDRNITHKRNIAKCSNLVWPSRLGDDLGIEVLFWDCCTHRG